MTPSEEVKSKFKKLHEKIDKFDKYFNEKYLQHIEIEKRAKGGLHKMQMTLDDIQNGVLEYSVDVIDKAPRKSLFSSAEPIQEREDCSPYIKIILRKTDELLLYEQRSETVSADSPDAAEVLRDNEHWSQIQLQTARERSLSAAEAQTQQVLLKSRDANTESIQRQAVGSYVSNFEMFDTYKDLEQSTKSVQVDGKQNIQITTYRVHGVDKFIEINEMPSFKLALMLTMRILAGNIFEAQQRRFRNMHLPDPLAISVSYKYRLELLWRCIPDAPNPELSANAVSDMSWCTKVGDILAVAYGIYSHNVTDQLPNKGCVRIWNIKNPVNAERCYFLHAPITCVEFSPFLPQLLAVGFSDGSVQVLDISSTDDVPIASSERNSLSSFEPITDIKWLPKAVGETYANEPFLALSQSGSVIKYRLINSPHLLDFLHIRLDRVVGCNLEGLPMPGPSDHVQANRHPQGLGLALTPADVDTFYVYTDEGCLHKCSNNYPHQTLGKLQAAEGAITAMDFSPWSSKLFLTCGNDWSIRIWIQGIFRPIITLFSKNSPVHCAAWTKTHSTIIISLNRKTVDIWDIQHSILKPITSTNIDKTFHTTFKFSNCGRSIAVGNEKGHVLMLALEEMPFPPEFQYEALEKSIFKAVQGDERLTAELRSIGYFGNTDSKRETKKKRQKKKS